MLSIIRIWLLAFVFGVVLAILHGRRDLIIVFGIITLFLGFCLILGHFTKIGRKKSNESTRPHV
jgi:hypothetical protein